MIISSFHDKIPLEVKAVIGIDIGGTKTSFALKIIPGELGKDAGVIGVVGLVLMNT